jgi:hypothetical protein
MQIFMTLYNASTTARKEFQDFKGIIRNNYAQDFKQKLNPFIIFQIYFKTNFLMAVEFEISLPSI